MEANRLFMLANAAVRQLSSVSIYWPSLARKHRMQDLGSRGYGRFVPLRSIGMDGTAEISPYISNGVHAPRFALILLAGSLPFLAGRSPVQAKNRAESHTHLVHSNIADSQC
jgi:hypothetical protein